MIPFAKLLYLLFRKNFNFHIQKAVFSTSCRKYPESAKYFNIKTRRPVRESIVKDCGILY